MWCTLGVVLVPAWRVGEPIPRCTASRYPETYVYCPLGAGMQLCKVAQFLGDLRRRRRAFNYLCKHSIIYGHVWIKQFSTAGLFCGELDAFFQYRYHFPNIFGIRSQLQHFSSGLHSRCSRKPTHQRLLLQQANCFFACTGSAAVLFVGLFRCFISLCMRFNGHILCILLNKATQILCWICSGRKRSHNGTPLVL